MVGRQDQAWTLGRLEWERLKGSPELQGEGETDSREKSQERLPIPFIVSQMEQVEGD